MRNKLPTYKIGVQSYSVLYVVLCVVFLAFCPRSTSKMTQSIIKDHMVSHYKKVYSAKGESLIQALHT